VTRTASTSASLSMISVRLWRLAESDLGPRL